MESGHIIIHEENFPLSLNGAFWRMHCACGVDFEAPTEKECRSLIGTHIYEMTRSPTPEENQHDLAGLQSRTNVLMDMCLASIEWRKGAVKRMDGQRDTIIALEVKVNEHASFTGHENTRLNIFIARLEALEVKVSELGERAEVCEGLIYGNSQSIQSLKMQPNKSYLEVLNKLNEFRVRLERVEEKSIPCNACGGSREILGPYGESLIPCPHCKVAK